MILDEIFIVLEWSFFLSGRWTTSLKRCDRFPKSTQKRIHVPHGIFFRWSEWESSPILCDSTGGKFNRNLGPSVTEKNGGLVRESGPQNHLDSDLGIILICPNSSFLWMYFFANFEALTHPGIV